MASFFQFSIRGLLCTISLMAIGLAALLNANSIWQGLACGGGSMPMMSGAGGSPMSGAVLVANPSFVPLNTYTNVFHALCLLLAAAVGGKTCQLACRTRPRMED